MDGVTGAINAARRKLKQELGIDPAHVPTDCFTFVARIHYKAPSDDVWGEHEIDYILVAQPPVDVPLNVNSNEVAEARFFQMDEVTKLCDPSNEELVSPWFRAIKVGCIYGS